MLFNAVEAVTKEMIKVPSVQKISVIGSLARKINKHCKGEGPIESVPIENEYYYLFGNSNLAFKMCVEKIKHSSNYKQSRMNDIDLAVWVSNTREIDKIRSALVTGLKKFVASGKWGVSNNEFDVFILQSGASKYIGNLCPYNTCPKGKDDCHVPGCGDTPFLKKFKDFTLFPDAITKKNRIDIFNRALQDGKPVHEDFDLEKTLNGIKKADLVNLIMRLYKLGKNTRKTTLKWLEKHK